MPVAMITGASRGFGRALALDLANDGWDLIIDARQERPLNEVSKRLDDAGVSAIRHVGDVADPAHRAALIKSAEMLGSLELIINNASTLGPSPLPTLELYPIDALRRVFEVNTIAPLALLQAALPLLRRSDGVAVSISSDAAIEAYEGWGGYGASKAALDFFHRVVAIEEPRLRIYQFDPGDMQTEMHQKAFPGEDISDRPQPESVVPSLRRLLDSGVPSGRYLASQWSRP